MTIFIVDIIIVDIIIVFIVYCIAHYNIKVVLLYKSAASYIKHKLFDKINHIISGNIHYLS
tara:strand:- start:1614 stop:1796 length:183 start_codon:yes stop_codon:yes gene_type:complete